MSIQASEKRGTSTGLNVPITFRDLELTTKSSNPRGDLKIS
jgi:hypothetical protein